MSEKLPILLTPNPITSAYEIRRSSIPIIRSIATIESPMFLFGACASSPSDTIEPYPLYARKLPVMKPRNRFLYPDMGVNTARVLSLELDIIITDMATTNMISMILIVICDLNDGTIPL